MDLVDLNQVLMPWLVIYFLTVINLEHKIVCVLALNTENQIEGGKQYTDISKSDLSKFVF